VFYHLTQAEEGIRVEFGIEIRGALWFDSDPGAELLKQK
jgi:hypothetical protein